MNGVKYINLTAHAEVGKAEIEGQKELIHI